MESGYPSFGCGSTFRCTADKIHHIPNSSSRLLYFHLNEKLYFHGKVVIQVVRGSIKINGAAFSAANTQSGIQVFSPWSHSAYFIEAIPSTETKKLNEDASDNIKSKKRKKEPSEQQKIEEILKKTWVSYCVAAVVLKPLESDSFAKAHAHLFAPRTIKYKNKEGAESPALESKNEDNEKKLKDPINIPGFLPLLESESQYQGLLIPDQWKDLEKVLKEGDKVPSILVCGSTNSGKSTLSRYLVNLLLNKYEKVGFLESDVGQCEFTPPGLVSLNIISSPILGPPWTHLTQPTKSLFVGATSPKNEPEYYCACVMELINFHRNVFTSVPLIINTHGWIKGTGLDMLIKIIRYAQPMHLVHLITPKDNSMDFMFFEGEEYSPQIWQFNAPNVGSNSPISSSDRRDMQFVEYFGEEVHHSVPFTVPWNKLRIRILYAEVAPSQTLYALNGSVVGLLCDSNQYHYASQDQQRFIDQHQLPLILAKTPIAECVGLGIVWSIDPIEKVFYIVTPVALSQLKHVNTIVKGEIEVPISFIKTGDDLVGGTPYLASNSISSEGSGAMVMKARSNLKRRGYEK